MILGIHEQNLAIQNNILNIKEISYLRRIIVDIESALVALGMNSLTCSTFQSGSGFKFLLKHLNSFPEVLVSIYSLNKFSCLSCGSEFFHRRI